MEVILWEADEEFPAQVSFTVPANLDRFWQLDAVLGLMGLVVKEMLRGQGRLRECFPGPQSWGWALPTTSLEKNLAETLG